MTTTNFPAVMNPSDLQSALAQSKVQETSSLAGVSFLKIDFETGEWLLGRDSDEVTGDEILVNTPTIQHGWILWSGGRNTKAMVKFTDDLPMPMAAIGEDHPSEGRSFQAAMADNGDPVMFDTNSYGGRKGVDVLLGAIKAHSAEGSDFLYPLVKLTSESYANKKRGGKLVYNPIFEVVAWCDREGNKEGVTAKVEDKSTTPEVSPAPEPETKEEKPKRQRRKRPSSAAAA